MSVVTRGVRNAFRNPVRTVAVVLILSLSVGMALAMLVARQAVENKISSVKSSVGNTVSVSPAGARGFEGGGNALTSSQMAKLTALSHVTSVDQRLQDRLTSSTTNLQSAVDAGNLGRRFSQNNGTSFSQGMPPEGAAMGRASDMGSNDGTAVRSFTPPVTLVGTTAPTDLSSVEGGGSFTLKSGQVFAAGSSDNVALVGTTLASKNNLKVGSTFTAYGKAVTVAAIFDAGNTFSNNQVIMPLKAVQTLSGQADAVTSATLQVDSVENVAAVTSAAKSALGSAADVTNDAERAQDSIAPLQNIRSVAAFSLVGAVVAGSVIILLTMIMIVRERRREIGVLKAIGASNLKVVGQFASEAVTFTIAGAVIGILIGVAAGSPLTRMLVNNASNGNASTAMQAAPGMGRGFGRAVEGARGLGRGFTNIQATVGWDIILYGLGVAVVIALAGSVLAAFFIAKVRPAEVMRAD